MTYNTYLYIVILYLIAGVLFDLSLYGTIREKINTKNNGFGEGKGIFVIILFFFLWLPLILLYFLFGRKR